MTSTKSIYLALLAVLLSPMTANADLVHYQFVGDSESGWSMNASGWSMIAEVVIDEEDLVPNTNLIEQLLNWSFTWTDGLDTFTNDHTNSNFSLIMAMSDRGFFTVNALLQVISSDLCTNSCGGLDGGLGSQNTRFDSWSGTVGQGVYAAGDGEWSGPIAHSVPEPGTLALLGLVLLEWQHDAERKSDKIIITIVRTKPRRVRGFLCLSKGRLMTRSRRR